MIRHQRLKEKGRGFSTGLLTLAYGLLLLGVTGTQYRTLGGLEAFPAEAINRPLGLFICFLLNLPLLRKLMTLRLASCGLVPIKS